MSSPKQIMWAVFDNDGCECKDFVGIFYTEDEANAAAAKIDTLVRLHYKTQSCWQWLGSITVEPVIPGEYELPANAERMQEKLTAK